MFLLKEKAEMFLSAAGLESFENMEDEEIKSEMKSEEEVTSDEL